MADLPHRLLQAHGKDRLSVLGETPLVAETPEDLLDDETTPASRFFIRNNGLLPERAPDPDSWSFVVDGEVERELRLTVADLKAQFAIKTWRMVLECGGNGRSFFEPPAEGNPWTNGGVGCAEWTGVSLADVLTAAGLKPSASHTAHFGADPDKNGDGGKAVDLARDAARKGDGAAHAAGLRHERTGAAVPAWRAAAAGGSGLARFAQPEMADPPVDSRPGA